MTTAPRMASSGVFQHLYSEGELAAMTTRERNRYERSLKNYRDILADKETTKVRIREAVEGADRARQLSTATVLKAMGVLSLSQIAEATGLSIDEVQRL